MRRLLRRLWALLQRRFDPPYKTVTVNGVPLRLKRRTLYVVEEAGFREQAAMLCPCGCRRVLQMNLLPDDRPYWELVQHANGTATLRPSVWRRKGCHSHFWFRRGRVLWCGKNPSL